MPLLKNGTYCVRLFNDAGHTDPNPRLNRITVLPDEPPTRRTAQAGAGKAPPRRAANVPVMIRAGDDHGLGRLRLEMKIKIVGAERRRTRRMHRSRPTGDEPVTVVKQWTDFAGDSTTAAVRQHPLELKPDMVKPGQTVLVRAVAWDKRRGQRLGARPEAAGDAPAAGTPSRSWPKTPRRPPPLEQLEGLRGAIWKILEKQIRTPGLGRRRDC